MRTRTLTLATALTALTLTGAATGAPVTLSVPIPAACQDRDAATAVKTAQRLDTATNQPNRKRRLLQWLPCQQRACPVGVSILTWPMASLKPLQTCRVQRDLGFCSVMPIQRCQIRAFSDYGSIVAEFSREDERQ